MCICACSVSSQKKTKLKRSFFIFHFFFSRGGGRGGVGTWHDNVAYIHTYDTRGVDGVNEAGGLSLSGAWATVVCTYSSQSQEQHRRYVLSGGWKALDRRAAVWKRCCGGKGVGIASLVGMGKKGRKNSVYIVEHMQTTPKGKHKLNHDACCRASRSKVTLVLSSPSPLNTGRSV